ncbi:MAG TPA: methyltransferase domain-containing protein [Candidatus Paceibacterota bacterium]
MAGTKQYFEENAKQWILDGYNDSGYNYPTAWHRVRIVSKFLTRLKNKRLKILDVACGGGDLAICLAQEGYDVVGVDQSKKMIEVAENRRMNLPKQIRNRLQFIRGEVGKVKLDAKFDIVTALGFIGYLPNDSALFKIADTLLKPNGHLIVSCRNRLFNMRSISFRTKDEIKNQNALNLVNELEGLYSQVPARDADRFIQRLKEVSKKLPEKTAYDKALMLSPSEKYSSYVSKLKDPVRQSTPKELQTTALKCGYKHAAYYGVHPHLMDPNLNKMLPPQIFNKISGCLEALEDLPISLAWSSVFIGAFQKNHGKK